ncbi:MAG: fatty acid desaturase [Pseudomonadota bacterium]
MYADRVIGLSLAALIIGAWFSLLVFSLGYADWSVLWPFAPFVVALQTWLFVGLFIVAHDAIHGTLAPRLPLVNEVIGTLCVGLYAGFTYGALAASHHDHHRFVGTDQDPDFHPEDPTHFWPWYIGFFRHYFTWRQFVALFLASVTLAVILQERAPYMLIFWALPAILSSFQLFYFGTYVPHRHDHEPFEDHHLSRRTNLPWLLSLLACFHFGHHHTHHAQPSVPWWRLPSASHLKEVAA